MKYRISCLTPTLVGDGEKLSPIDYMVWKDQVNVLDQKRIFRLLARGPRLEGYLGQLKRAEKLDFASWGGFAQNYAGRRIPFEHPSSTNVWEKARAENLFIPTFVSGHQGPYLPGSALRGAFRTAVVAGRASARVLQEASAASEGRRTRQIAGAVEDAALGPGGANAMRLFGVSDSQPVAQNSFRVYLLRVSTLEPRPSGRYELGWKQPARGGAKRAEDGTPIFAEMAAPGTVFQGEWRENGFLAKPEIAKALRARERPSLTAMYEAINSHAAQVLEVQLRYAEWAGLTVLRTNLEGLKAKLVEMQAGQERCLLPLGWGSGFFSKTAFLDTREAALRTILGQLPYYARAIQSNLPFPKTRRILFLENQPATLPGFVELQVGP